MNHEPLIVLASSRTNTPLVNVLWQRYVEGYRVLSVVPDDDGITQIASLHEQGEPVALFVYEDCAEADAFIRQCAILYPNAQSLMVGEPAVEAVDPAETQLEINRIDVWSPPENRLYPLLDELLADWRILTQNAAARVSAVMTVRVVRIRVTDTLRRAAEMIALSGVGDLMVIDSDNKFVGVLSVGDVLRAAMPDIGEIMDEGGTLDQAFELFLRKGRELMYRSVAPLVITNPLVLDPDDHIAKAATLMIEKNIHLLPVVKNGRLMGTVGRADICQAVVGTL
jgi:CBS domain-containing protein